jgi:4-hydroxybenzoate polyprenyltransferase
LALAYAYGINAIFDRGSDEDPHKNVLVGRERVPLATVLSVMGAGFFALWGASTLGHIAFFSIAGSIAAGTIYSAGPRLKRFPGVGLLGNLLIFAPLMASALRPGSTPVGFPVLFAVFALLVTQNQLMHEEGDVLEDVAAGAFTTARWLGPRGTRMTLWILALGIAGAGALAPTPIGFAVCLATAALSILIATYVEHAKTRRKAHRYLSAIMGVVLFFVLLHS